MKQDISPEFQAMLLANHCTSYRLINGSVCVLYRFLATTGLLTGIDNVDYFARFCFQDARDAERALKEWDGLGYPPGPWLKQKGPVEYHNPLMYRHKGGPIYERYDFPIGDVWKSQGPREFVWLDYQEWKAKYAESAFT